MKHIFLPYKIDEKKAVLGSDGKWYSSILLEEDEVVLINDGYYRYVADLPDALKNDNGDPIHSFYGYAMDAYGDGY